MHDWHREERRFGVFWVCQRCGYDMPGSAKPSLTETVPFLLSPSHIVAKRGEGEIIRMDCDGYIAFQIMTS